MKSRRQAREAALQALYMCDTLQDFSIQQIDIFFQNFRSEDMVVDEQSVLDTVAFARVLCEGALRHMHELDVELASASTHWSVARMSRVDRNLLRCAAYEILFVADVPVNVSINEAIEIAKRYGTDESPHFINGVLDHFASTANFRVAKVGSEQRRATTTLKVVNG